MDLVKDLHHTNHHLYVNNFYTSPILLFYLLNARGIFAAGNARTTNPMDELKSVNLKKRGQVAWLATADQQMTAIRLEDKKDVYLLSTIHPPADVPDWFDEDNVSDADLDDEREENVAFRRVKARLHWRFLLRFCL